MRILGIDVGSSSVRAAMLNHGQIDGPIARAEFETRMEGVRTEVEPDDILKALAHVVRQLGPAAREADVVALDNMAPSWVAMDKRGKAITPIVTHQDRRSIEQARDLEERIGKARCQKLAGTRPFPGSISSTTWLWFNQNAPAVMKRADLVGHLNTFLHRHLTSARVTDPSNASFMGVYSTLKLSGWNSELCDAVGARKELLPEVLDSNVIAGRVTAEAAAWSGLKAGTPMMAGCMDGSAAMFLAGPKRGQLVNVAGSTDVLALCTDSPAPHDRLLTRALGVGRWWLSVSTLAAGGSAIEWAHRTLFSELDENTYRDLAGRLAREKSRCCVRFEPYLAGDRMSIEQRQGEFHGLTLSTTREEMLRAVIESLATASAARVPLLQQGGVRIRRNVMVTGGVQQGLRDLLYRDWRGQWDFKPEDEATLRGLGCLQPVSERGGGR